MNWSKQLTKQGQAALIVLLVVAVALGFGLSIISQSTTDVRISTQEQNASRVFNAAEAGIEEALKNISGIPLGATQTVTGLDGDIEVAYLVNASSDVEAGFGENEVVQVNLTGADVSLNTVTINWVKENSSAENPGCTDENLTPASLQITLIKEASANYAKRSYAYNACEALDNNMTFVATEGDGDFLKKVAVAVESDDALMRIRLVYNQATVAVSGNVALPTQGYEIASSAQVANVASKAIEVTRSEPAAPPIFDYVLFSGTSIVK